MDEDGRLERPEQDRGGIEGRGWLDAIAHAYTHGQDIWPLLSRRLTEVDLIALELVQRAAGELEHRDRRDSAVMTGNAVNGAKSVDGMAQSD